MMKLEPLCVLDEGIRDPLAPFRSFVGPGASEVRPRAFAGF